MARDKSIANEKGEKLAARVHEFFTAHCETLKGTKRWSRITRSVGAYYSESDGDETEIQSGGAQGELTLLKPNEYRSLTQSQLNTITQHPPAYEAGAKTSDVKAVEGARLAQMILNHYLRFKRLDNIRVRRAEVAAVCSESFLHAPWDTALGRKALASADGESAEAEGDFLFEVAGPWDCAIDYLSPDRTRPRQACFRAARNRYDLAAKYTKHKDAILKAEAFREGLDDFGGHTDVTSPESADDYVAVLYYYCERTTDCPEGREAMIFDEKIVLEAGPLSYARCPVFRLAPCERIVGPGGHTNNFELLPLTEAFAAEVSVIISNHATFAGQQIAIHKGTGVKPHHLGNGMNSLEWDSGGQNLPPPQALTLCATPPEVFEMANLLRGMGERQLAVSAATRGESVEGDSGSKSALLANAAEKFATSFYTALAGSDEDVGEHIIDTTRRRATVPRMVSIAGKANTAAAREFTGVDLEGVAFVTVRARDPVLDTVEGREWMAPHLLKLQGGITTGEQFKEFMTTGRYTPMYEGPIADVPLIERENEELLDPTKPLPLVAPTDQHTEHYKGHAKLYADPEVRRNQELMARIDQHVQMHEMRLTKGSPEYAGDIALLMTGQRPLPSPEELAGGKNGGAPPVKGAAAPPMPPGAPPANDNAALPSGGPPKMPGMPSMPTDPSTGRPAGPPPAQAQG